MTELPADLARCLHGEADPATVTHREPMRRAFEMPRRYDFPEIVLNDSRALRALCARAEAPGKFHQTITVAFLTLLAERMYEYSTGTFEAFALAHPDLLDGTALERLYSPERLASAAARARFVLPSPLARSRGTRAADLRCHARQDHLLCAAAHSLVRTSTLRCPGAP